MVSIRRLARKSYAYFMSNIWLGLPAWSLYIITGIFGACLGSFAGVCIERLPRGKSIVYPASHCTACTNRIKACENIPILSYLILKGRCSKCGTRISLLCPLVEIIMAVISVFAWIHFKNPLEYFIYLLLFLLPMVIVTFIDLKHMIIPDVISIPGIFIGIAVHTFLKIDGSYAASLLNSLVGILVGGGSLFLIAFFYEKIKKEEGLGGGDIKLIAMFGAFFGWKSVILIMLLSSILGSIIGLITIIILKKDGKYAIPYGPFLVFAAILNLFWGQDIVRWYLRLF
jgi:leader peptidase (prepilin peptidase)/N-methyltransferase